MSNSNRINKEPGVNQTELTEFIAKLDSKNQIIDNFRILLPKSNGSNVNDLSKEGVERGAFLLYNAKTSLRVKKVSNYEYVKIVEFKLPIEKNTLSNLVDAMHKDFEDYVKTFIKKDLAHIYYRSFMLPGLANNYVVPAPSGNYELRYYVAFDIE